MKLLKSLSCALLLGTLATGCDSSESPVHHKPGESNLEPKPYLEAEQVSGTYLLVVSTSVAPKIPVVYLAEIEAERVADQLALHIRQRPLSKSDRTTPVGPWSDWFDGVLDADGTFNSDALAMTIPAAANALTGFDSGVEIGLSSVLEPSEEETVDFLCGDVRGRILSPIPLDDLSGSTFTATRIADVDDPESYPEAVINCDREPARAL